VLLQQQCLAGPAAVAASAVCMCSISTGFEGSPGKPEWRQQPCQCDCVLGAVPGVAAVLLAAAGVSICVVLISTWPRDPQGSPSNTQGGRWLQQSCYVYGSAEVSRRVALWL
jgi:hypothetical protein